MDLDLVFDLVIGTIVLGAAVLKSSQLWRDPDDRPLWALTGGLWCMAIATTVGISTWRNDLDELTAGLVTVVVNLSIMGAATALVLFFVWSVNAANAARATRWLLVSFGVATALVLLGWVAGDAYERLNMVGESTAGRWNTTLFAAVVLGYTLFCWIIGLIYAARYWHRAARARTRVALSLVAAGMAGMTVFSFAGVVRALMRLGLRPDSPLDEALGDAYILGKGFGQTLIVFGLCVAGLLAAFERLALRRRQRAAARVLAPLRARVEQQFPDIMLHRWLQTTEPSTFYRSVIEIRDALVELGPYYPRDAETPAAPTGPEVATAGRMTLAQTADMVAAGFHAHARDATPQPPPHPHVGPPTAEVSLTEDARWLVELADELGRQGFYGDNRAHPLPRR